MSDVDGDRLRICLLAPPLTEPGVPNLAIELLAATARAAGHQVTTVHGALLQPRTFRNALIHGLPAPVAFTPGYFGLDAELVAAETASAVMSDFADREELTESFQGSLADDLFFAMNDAERCVEAVCSAIATNRFDLIGFSIGFDSQKMPAAAIAQRLRARGETAVFVAGGTGCDGPMGQAMLEFCAELDLVLQGEAETSWPALLAALSGEDSELMFEHVPGAVWRRPDGGYGQATEHAFDGAFLTAAEPDYTDFVAQRAASQYTTSKSFILFETSRGCWWGRRRHCTFCGIRNVQGPYRVRDAAEAVELIGRLQARYAPDVLYATDSIADSSFDDTVWPELARRRRDGEDWSLFYETKSDLTRRRTARLAAAGVQHLQPGIESLSSPVLRLMRKGATALQQVAMLKWALTYDIDLHYSLMTGLPGETAEHIDDMIELIDAIPHLPPPADLNHLALHRFSPHFDDPEAHGLQNVRPFAVQRVIYRCDDELLRRLCYQLEFDVGAGADVLEARRRLRQAIRRWRHRHEDGAELTFAVAGSVRLVRSTCEGRHCVELVHDPVEVHVFDACQEVTRLDRLVRTAPAPETAVLDAVDRLRRHGFIVVDGPSVVCLVQPEQADAHGDARFDDATDRPVVDLQLQPARRSPSP